MTDGTGIGTNNLRRNSLGLMAVTFMVIVRATRTGRPLIKKYC